MEMKKCLGDAELVFFFLDLHTCSEKLFEDKGVGHVCASHSGFGERKKNYNLDDLKSTGHFTFFKFKYI